MGNDCNRINQLAMADYPLIQPIQHPAFGLIIHLSSDMHRNEKALKRIFSPSQQTLDTLKTRIQFANECDHSISTLLQIYEYQMVANSSQEAALWSKLEDESCGSHETPFIIIHFQYFPPECCLSTILRSRRQSLQRVGRKYGKEMVSAAHQVKLCDYKQIDKLQAQLRQIVNHHYQQIEIARMIDHLIGALYFLHHFYGPHGAVRLETVLVDGEGKFILIDREFFSIRSNYELALQALKNEGQSRKGLEFLAPQCLIDIKEKCQYPTTNSEKIDIYCVGLVALRMCLVEVDQPLFEYRIERKAFVFNEQQLNFRLLAVQRQYSSKLTQLLARMLKRDPKQRFDFTELIEHLNPLLLKNLQEIKLIHTPNKPTKIQSESDEPFSDPHQKNVLKEKLASIQEQFQRVMNNRTMLFHRNINEKQIREEEEKILKKLEKIKYVRSAFQSTEPPASKRNRLEKYTPAVKTFSLSGGASQLQSPSNATGREGSKRYLSGKELQAIVRHEYVNIKSKRG